MNTCELIDKCVEYDGGARYRGFLRERIDQLADAFDTREDRGGRNHLGASVIGDPCARKLWYGFRSGQSPQFTGRLLRLFNRGHLEEARFEALLLTIGCQLWTHSTNGEQFKFSLFSGHFGGSLDSIVKGIPELPHEPVLAEYKTHSDKSFTQLQNKGLFTVHHKHYVQMQVYMGNFGLENGLYLAVNKNTDDLYSELVPFRKEVSEYYTQRAHDIVFSQRIPPRMSDNAGWWQCKMCDLHSMCFNDKSRVITIKKCRNCTHAITTPHGWSCCLAHVPVAVDSKHVCPSWQAHPDL